MKLLLDPSAPEHPKIWALSDALKCGDVVAFGMIVRLWCKAMSLRESGSFTGWTPRHIARAAGWKKWEDDSEQFVSAVLACGLLDEIPEGGYRVHDWLEHQGVLIERRVRDRESKREKRHAMANPNGKQEAPPIDKGSSLSARCAAMYVRENPGIISIDKATKHLEFFLAAGASPRDVEAWCGTSAKCKGRRIWELETLVPKSKKTGNWLDAIAEIVGGKEGK